MKIQKLSREIAFTYHNEGGEECAAVDYALFEGVQIQDGEVVYTVTLHQGALRVRVYGRALDAIQIIPNTASEFLVKPQMYVPPTEPAWKSDWSGYETGARNTCAACKHPIVYTGRHWDHEDVNPRHIGMPSEPPA